MADSDPHDVFGDLIDAFIGFFFYSDNCQRGSSFSSSLSHKKWELAVAGDQPVFRKRIFGRICQSLFAERCYFARLAEHLVDLIEVKFFQQDHLACILFESDRFALGK